MESDRPPITNHESQTQIPSGQSNQHQQPSAQPQQPPDTQPSKGIFTSKAHIFEIDPHTKRSWDQRSDSAVPISLYLDPKKVLHLTGRDEISQHTILDSIITPKTTFTRTAQKFGQWTDSRAGTVYGLGFASELELSRFLDKFEEFKEKSSRYYIPTAPNATSQPSHTEQQTDHHSNLNQQPSSASRQQKTQKNDSSEQENSNVNSNVNSYGTNGHHVIGLASDDGVGVSGDGSFGNHHRSQSFSGLGQKTVSSQSTGQNNAVSGQNVNVMTPDKYKTIGHHNRTSHQAHSVSSVNHNNSQPSPSENEINQVRYERDRLKLALEQSSSNAKEWQSELQKLRTNNLKLTAALQESKANVDEWKRQLSTLKNENSKLQARILELEASNNNEGGVNHEALNEFEKDLESILNKLKTKLGHRS